MGDVITFRPRPRPARPAVRHHRARIEGAVAHALDVVDELIAVLDGLDAPSEDLEPDTDLEDGGDAEPSLAAPIGGPSQRVWAAGGSQDLERE